MKNNSIDNFQNTEIGLIPKDWKIEKLKHICSMKSGATITAKSISISGKYPCYGGNGLLGFTSKYTHEGAFVLS